MKEVQIRICGTQRAEGQEDTLETLAFGESGVLGSTKYLKFEEVSEDGEKIQTLIKFADNTLEVIKKGTIQSKMIFRENDVIQTDYDTPYGTFLMSIDTDILRYEEKEEEIKIYIKYQLYLNGEFVSENELDIEAVTK